MGFQSSISSVISTASQVSALKEIVETQKESQLSSNQKAALDAKRNMGQRTSAEEIKKMNSEDLAKAVGEAQYNQELFDRNVKDARDEAAVKNGLGNALKEAEAKAPPVPDDADKSFDALNRMLKRGEAKKMVKQNGMRRLSMLQLANNSSNEGTIPTLNVPNKGPSGSAKEGAKFARRGGR